MSNYIKYFVLSFLLGASISSITYAEQSEKIGIQAQKNITRIIPVNKEQLAKSRRIQLSPTDVAFLKTPFTSIEIQHELVLQKQQPPLMVKSFFSEKGHFVAMESVNKIPDPRRMQTEYIEKGMKNINNRIIERKELDNKVLLDELWKVIARRIDLKQIQEFNIHHVEYEFDDGARHPVFIVNIWGPDNPLNMPEGLPAVLKNRIRIIYDYQNKTLFADNLL